MALPIIGMVILFIVWGIVNTAAWVLLLTNIAPTWTIWVAGITNLVLGGIVMGYISWIKEELEDRKLEKEFK